MNRTFQTIYILAVLLLICLVKPGNTSVDQISTPHTVKSFIHNLIGEWVGTYEQLTNGKKASTKYFHAVFKQTAPDTFQTIFEYYRLDDQTGAPIKVGESVMTTRETSDGTATNDIIGKGVVLIDPTTTKPEKHDLSEVLSVSTGGLQGDGSGTISVSEMAFGMGRNGKVTDEHSDWTMQNSTLKIRQELKARFKILFFSKSFTITAEFIGNPGSDINALMRHARAKLSEHKTPETP